VVLINKEWRKQNEYKKIIDIHEQKRIIGGNEWGSAAIGAMGGAATGVKWCKVAGPWVTVGCAVVGAGIGGWAGYHGS